MKTKMNLFKIIILFILVTISALGNAQQNHMNFLNVGMENDIEKFSKEIQLQGYAFSEDVINSKVFTGLFQGNECEIYVFFTPESRVVYRALIHLLPNNFVGSNIETKSNSGKDFNEVKNQLIEKDGRYYYTKVQTRFVTGKRKGDAGFTNGTGKFNIDKAIYKARNIGDKKLLKELYNIQDKMGNTKIYIERKGIGVRWNWIGEDKIGYNLVGKRSKGYDMAIKFIMDNDFIDYDKKKVFDVVADLNREWKKPKQTKIELTYYELVNKYEKKYGTFDMLNESEVENNPNIKEQLGEDVVQICYRKVISGNIVITMRRDMIEITYDDEYNVQKYKNEVENQL